MKFKKIALGSLAILAVAAAAYWFSLDKETRGLLATVPTNRDILFWTQARTALIWPCAPKRAAWILGSSPWSARTRWPRMPLPRKRLPQTLQMRVL